ncbi:FAD-dependent oxidoreductase [Nocardioides sp. YIM 152588]|uniref:FAD-dependent oxidoreductase n=1 Tax=Nocardioides sp. YIM 152588 TaxID=3158259 RepID=UPI0032E3819E
MSAWGLISGGDVTALAYDGRDYDLIVIGGGGAGLSTAYHAGKNGLRTLVLERFGVLNDSGSSAGASRQFRLQYAQQYMAELSLASQSFWADLQGFTQKTLITQCGSLWFGDPALSSQEGGIQAAEKVMDTLRIPYTKLDAAQIEAAFPFTDLPSDYAGFFQASGGIIDLKATEEACYDAALATGRVDIHEYEPVTGISEQADGSLTVTTGRGDYGAAKLAVCAGAYANDVLAHLGLSAGITIWQMSSAYFRKSDPDLRLPTWFVFQDPSASALFYGFPEVDWAHPGYARVATDFPDAILTDPGQRTFVPSPTSLGLDSRWVAEHMVGLDPTPRFTSTCLIALAEDSTRELLLDYTPAWGTPHPNIVTYTAGWAAKYLPILGDMIVRMLAQPTQQLTYGDFTIPLANFAIAWAPAAEPDQRTTPSRAIKEER